MRRAPSYADVARAAGVSQTTVSFVLNGRTDIPLLAATRERVLSAARDLGYRRNSLARSLVHGRTQTIGMLVPQLDSSFSAAIAQGVQEGLESQDYRVLLGHARHDATVEARQVELFLEHRVDGMIAVTDEFTIEHLEDWLQELLMQDTPCVLVDDSSFRGKVDCVVSDDSHGVRQVVEHLRSLGHRRIAHLAGGDRVSSGRDRLSAFEAAAQDAGIASEVVVVPSPGYVLTPWGDRVRELMQRSPAPTALFCANDIVAVEALDTLEELGIRVPDEVSVVGYAGFEVGRALKLTSVNQHPHEMGRVAARRLLERIDNRDLPPQLFTLPVELEPRRTSAPAPR